MEREFGYRTNNLGPIGKGVNYGRLQEQVSLTGFLVHVIKWEVSSCEPHRYDKSVQSVLGRHSILS